jgi:hypothetical protein
MTRQVLSPLSTFVSDIRRIDLGLVVEAITPLLCSITQLGTRHRKTLQPLLNTLITLPGSGYAAGVQHSLMDEAIATAGLDKDELGVIKIAVELRCGSRRVGENREGIEGKKLTEEFERRE